VCFGEFACQCDLGYPARIAALQRRVQRPDGASRCRRWFVSVCPTPTVRPIPSVLSFTTMRLRGPSRISPSISPIPPRCHGNDCSTRSFGLLEASRRRVTRPPSEAATSLSAGRVVDLRDGVDGRPRPPSVPYDNSSFYPARQSPPPTTRRIRLTSARSTTRPFSPHLPIVRLPDRTTGQYLDL